MFDYEKVDIVIDKIVGDVNPRKVIVFGSVARGDAGKNSDLDLLVLFDKLDDEKEMFKRIGRHFIGMRLAFDLVVMTSDEFDHYSALEQSFEHEILTTGKVVYAQ